MKTLVIVSRAHADTAFSLAEEMYKDGDTIHIFLHLLHRQGHPSHRQG